MHESIKFFITEEDFAISVFWQFMLLELAIDGLKLASLNTPESLGMSLSVIGALILGEFSVSSGWFIPQTILCMAVVALASFTQPSIELGYGIKFIRVLMLIGAHVFGWRRHGGGFCAVHNRNGYYENNRWNIVSVSRNTVEWK
ncbi:MAG: spore germination protein [Clostridia bacterium]